MATILDTVRIVRDATQSYFQALATGDQVAAESYRSTVTNLTGQTPEEFSLANNTLANRSSVASAGISLVTPSQISTTGVFDNRSVGFQAGSPLSPSDIQPTNRNNPDVSSGPIPNEDLNLRRNRIDFLPTPVETPSTLIRNIDPGCDYRYSFGCPIFTKWPLNPQGVRDAGCRLMIPVYRTCTKPQTFLSDPKSQSFTSTPELIGYIEVPSEFFTDYNVPYTLNGVKGTRTIQGNRWGANSIRDFILALDGFSSGDPYIDSYVERPDQSGPGERVIALSTRQSERKLDMKTVIQNLLPTSLTGQSLSGAQTIAKANIEEIADYWSNKCKLDAPAYCITSEVFVPSTPITPTPNSGPRRGRFCNQLVEVQIPNSRRFIGTTQNTVEGINNPVVVGQASVGQASIDNRIRIPNKPCLVGRPVTIETIEEYEISFGYICYDTQNVDGSFGGNIIDYVITRTEIERVTTNRYTDYVDIIPDKNCGYREVEHEYDEDDPSDKCFGITKKDVTRIYDDGRIESYSKGTFVRYFRKQDADCAPETIKIYHPLDLGKDVINAKIRAKTKGLFDGSQTLECHHTSSTQNTSSKSHYYEVTDCDSCGKVPYFAVAYGHNQGSGSTWAEGEVNDTPTRAVYGQYRLMALEMPETQFTFYTNGVPTASKDVYVINFSRTGLSDRIDPGNWELPLAELRGGSYTNNVFTGSNVAVSSSNKVMTFIDDSEDRSDTVSCTHDPFVSYDIVSGSLLYGAHPTSSRHTYGISYPNLGIIVLDPYKLNTELGFNTVTGSNIAGDNSFKLFTSISGSGVLGNYLKARNVKYKATNHYFVRIAAPFANYSNNPTWVSGSEGAFFHPCFDLNPQTYITSIGLYDDFNQLLAVAKLSRPINKSFDNDVLIKIRLNW